MSDITPIGKTDWRNQQQVFGIKDQDRMSATYCIGKSGVGKSTLLLNMAISDIIRGHGLAIIDPHSDLATTILEYIPHERINDVIYFNPKDTKYPIAFNPLHNVPIESRHLVASGLISTFKKIWADTWGPRLEYILRFSILLLLEYPDATLLDIQPLLTNADFRNKILTYTINKEILNFWKMEFEKYSPTLRSEAITPILNKTGIFLTCLPLKSIVGQKRNSFTMQQVLDEGKILILNLSKGELGEEVVSILGSMIVTAIQLTAMQRAGIPENERKPFFLFCDEVQSFVNLSFIDLLAEARKFRLSLFLTHQYIEQLPDRIRAAIFGNAGTFISFRIGAEDAKYVAKEFYPVFNESDLINLPRYSMYLKLMIDGATSKPFSAITLPIKANNNSFRKIIISASQKKYGNKYRVVENIISTYQALVRPYEGEQTLFD